MVLFQLWRIQINGKWDTLLSDKTTYVKCKNWHFPLFNTIYCSQLLCAFSNDITIYNSYWNVMFHALVEYGYFCNYNSRNQRLEVCTPQLMCRFHIVMSITRLFLYLRYAFEVWKTGYLYSITQSSGLHFVISININIDNWLSDQFFS